MNRFVMVCGLPASGKDTFINNNLKDFIVHSSDKIRGELYLDESIQEDNPRVFELLHKRVKESLMSGKNVCYNATNISYKRRMAFLQEIRKITCEKICILIATPFEQCVMQSQMRDRKVSEEVIVKMYKNFFIPQYYEGWDKIEIVWNCDINNFNVFNLFNWLSTIEQENEHHSLTIGNHCLKCAEYLVDNPELYLAGTYHDIGKAFCKTFINTKGESTSIAHYYQHHLVSAYMALFYLKSDYRFNLSDEDILNICNLIQWHMQPFNVATEKAKNKYLNLLGNTTWNKILKLHEADTLAK